MKSLCFVLFGLIFFQEIIAQCNEPLAVDNLDINNISIPFMVSGELFTDLENGFFYAPGGNEGHFAMGGLWISGIDSNGDLRAAAMTNGAWGNDFWAGPLDDNGEPVNCDSFDRIWKVERNEIEAHISDFLYGSINDTIPTAILEWPAKDNPNLDFLPPGDDLAPYVDNNNDGIYNALDGDYPLIKGDQALWFVFNDNGGEHTSTEGEPMKIEVACMAYAYKSDNFLDEVIFFDYTIENKNGSPYSEFYIGAWADADVGDPTDDYIGCNPSLNIGYAYNENETDFTFQSNEIPIVGFQFLSGLTDEMGNDLKMSTFNHYTSFTADSDNKCNRALKGLDEYGDVILDPDGNITTLMFYDNPSNLDGWSECNAPIYANDKRYVIATGPSNLLPNVSTEITCSIIYADHILHPCPDLSPLFEIAEQNMFVYDNDLYEDSVYVSNIDPIEKEKDILIYPNPATDFILIDYPHDLILDKVSLYDLNGKLVLTSKETRTKIDISALSGLFIIEAIGENGQVLIEKVIIQ